MKITPISFNIVLKKKEFVPGQLRLSDLKDAINDTRDVFRSPIINQLPDLTLFIYPDQQFTISFQKETIVISDNSTDAVTEKLDDFIDIVKTVEDTTKSEGTMYAYGFNYELDMELEEKDTSVLRSFINESEAKNKNLLNGGKMITGAVKIVSEIEETKYSTTNLIPLLDKEFKDSKKIRCKYNLHYSGVEKLPNVAKLKSDYKESYTSLTSLLPNLDG